MDAPTTERVPLSRVIQCVEQVAAMDTPDLERLLAEHQAELVRLVGALEGHRVQNVAAARQAERILRLHKSWIERELRQRRHAAEVAAAQEHQRARAAAHQAILERSHADKLARIEASSSENMRQYATFKAVARERLGAQKYLELWTEVRARLAQEDTRC